MKKRIKMVLYGEPGVGKSTFAGKAPNPYFICTDGNFAWLDLPEENHVEVSSWSEAKKVFKDIPEWAETVIVDLTEDLFRWCESEFCLKNKIEHIGDLGFGKGYSITRDEFFIEVCKLISYDKNVIFIMHGQTVVEKDRRGVEHTKFRPTSRIPDKVVDMIEGRVRYFLRCYLKDEEHDDNTVTKKRYLSLVPKPNEFGIIRGVDENTIPQDIELDWNTFADIVGLDTSPIIENKPIKKTVKKVEKPVIEETKVVDEIIIEEPTEKIVEESVKETKVETEEQVVKTKTEEPAISNAEKLAAIKAKLDAMKNK